MSTALPTDEIDGIAAEIRTAQDSVRQIAPPSSRHGDFALSDAYAVARAIHSVRLAAGAVALGRKIGFTNAKMQAQYGTREPIWGYVYDTTLVRLGTNGGHTFSLGRFSEPRIEPEIVFRLRSVPPPGADLQAILDCSDQIAHGFEIVQSVYPSWQFRAADTIANSGMHAALLLGEPQPLSALGSDPLGILERFSLTLHCNGEVRDTGTGSNVLGSPLRALSHLASLLGNQPETNPPQRLQPGEWITTGTITGAPYIRPGEVWTTELAGIALPGLRVEFVA